MAISQIGMIIRRRRMELGLSQEDLADGICAVTTLSRIENGERMPTQNHLEILLQRIGYSDMMLQSYVDENDFIAHELKFKIRQAYIEKDATKARELLQQFEALVAKPSKVDEQFILLQRIWLYSERYTNEERLQELERAIRLTHPKYKQGSVPFLLSYEEIVLLNNIAINLALYNNRKDAIDMLYNIVRYYDTHIVNIEETLRTEPMILYNLSKMLGLENRFDECISICDRGIQLAQRTGRSQFFGKTLYNKAWACLKRDSMKHLQEASNLIQRALSIAIAFEDEQLAESCKSLIKTYNLSQAYCITSA